MYQIVYSVNSHLIEVISLCAIVFTLGILLFSFVRVRHAAIYQPRELHYKSTDYQISDNLFGWLRIYFLTDDQISRHAGLEALAFVKTLWMMFKICSTCFLTALVILFPAYLWGSGGASLWSTDLLYHLSILNVAAGSRRLWASLISAYLFTAITVCFTRQTYKEQVQKATKARSGSDIQNYTVLLTEVPLRLQNNIKLKKFFEATFGEGSVHSAISVVDCVELIKMVDQYKLLSRKCQPSECPSNCCKKLEQLCINRKDIVWRMAGSELAIKRILNERPGFGWNPSRIAFVTFRRLQDATQAGRSDSFLEFHTSRAPKPKNVYYMNASVSQRMRTCKKGVMFVVMLLLVMFWSIPVGFFQTLTSLDKVEMKWHPLADLARNLNPQLKTILQAYIPIIVMQTWVSLLPQLIYSLAHRIPFITKSSHLHFAITWLNDSLVIIILFVNFTFGSFWDIVQVFRPTDATTGKKPWYNDLYKTLGNSFPGQSSYFVEYILMSGFVFKIGDLLRLEFFYSKLFACKGCDCCVSSHFDFYLYYPWMVLIFTLTMTFAVHSPCILLASALYFLIVYGIFLWQLVFVYKRSEDESGAFPYIHSRIYVGLWIMGLTLLAVFSLKNGLFQAPLTIPLFGIFYYFYGATERKYRSFFSVLPLDMAAEIDRKRGSLMDSWDDEETWEQKDNPYDVVSRLANFRCVSMDEGNEAEVETPLLQSYRLSPVFGSS